MISFELIAVIIAVIGNIFLGLFTFLKNPKSRTNILFFLFTFIIAIYIIFNYLISQQSTAVATFFWVKMVMSIAPFINIVFFLLIKTFPQRKLSIKPLFLLLIISSAILFIPLSQLNLIFTSVPKIGAGAGTPGLAMPFFLLQTIVFLGGGFYILVRKFHKSVGREREQIKLFLIGAIFLFVLILITNVFFVIVFHITALIGLLPVYTLIFNGFVSYAIIRHRFLDVSLVVAHSVGYLILLMLVVVIYTSGLFFISKSFFDNGLKLYQAIVYAILTLIIVFTFEPIRVYLENVTDKIFFKGKYTSNELVLSLTQIMASTLFLEELTKRTLNQLLTTMRITYGAFILFKVNKPLYVVNQGSQETANVSTEDVRKLIDLKRIIIFDEEENIEIKQTMRDLNAIVILPLHEDDHDEGILLLGEKKSGEIYSEQDIDILKIFGPEVSVALHNAESYEEISRFNVTLKDEVNKATNHLKIANEKLKELDKLKNEFVSVASHELRTPMTAIRSYLWMTLQGKGGPLSEKQRYYVERGYNSAGRLIRLVNDMLNISRIESGRITINLQSVDLVKLAQEVMDEVLTHAREVGVTVNLQKQESLPRVLADADKLKEVFFNLIGNSLKFTPKGGSITISFARKDGFVETKIADTGIGIEPEDVGKLFQKFGMLSGSYVTNQKTMGTGLGLYICRSIITLHSGKIEALSAGHGKGTTFTFTVKEFNEADMKPFKTEASDDKKDNIGLIHTEI